MRTLNFGGGGGTDPMNPPGYVPELGEYGGGGGRSVFYPNDTVPSVALPAWWTSRYRRPPGGAPPPRSADTR